MRRKIRKIHDGNLWLRLAQIIKVEEPVSFDQIRRFTRDVSIAQLDFTLREMAQARRICVSREWLDNTVSNEIYTYLG